MPERNARIDLTNLPLRPRQLKPGDLQNVFGGCIGSVDSSDVLLACVSDSECCWPRKCRPGRWFSYCSAIG